MDFDYSLITAVVAAVALTVALSTKDARTQRWAVGVSYGLACVSLWTPAYVPAGLAVIAVSGPMLALRA